jgi:hypothetical protein
MPTFTNATFPPGTINCFTLHFGYREIVCEPMVNGLPLYPLNAADDNTGASANDVDWSTYQVNYRNRRDFLCVVHNVILNLTSLYGENHTLPYNGPYLGWQLLAASDVLGMKEANAQYPFTNRSDSRIDKFGEETQRKLVYVNYNSAMLSDFVVSKRVDLNGRVTLSYVLGTVSQIAMGPIEQSRGLDIMRENISPENYTRFETLLSQPDNALYQFEFCMYPSSFLVTTVTEVASYGYLNFLADLGGFLNISALIFYLLFPLITAPARPRVSKNSTEIMRSVDIQLFFADYLSHGSVLYDLSIGFVSSFC